MTEDEAKPLNLNQWLLRWHLDLPLLLGLVACGVLGVLMLYSASGQSMEIVVAQLVRLGVGFTALVIVAQIPPHWYRTAAGWAYAGGVLLLALVLLVGETTMGSQRWLDFGPVQFQPSLLMKLIVPVTIAAYFHERPLPPRITDVAITAALLAPPVALIAVEPDLGMSFLVLLSGASVLFLAGLRWRVIAVLALFAVLAAPLVWFNMHEYQQERILTFLNPSRDPLGAGYHIIQSKIAVGSGGLFGKGWLNSTQATLNFLPASLTDFLFAVYAEETGLLGCLALLALYAFLIVRGLVIAANSQDTFQRLVAGSICVMFFVYVFVNIGMVIGIMPVAGVPLPLLSYGGTSMVVLLTGFGMLMSIHTHRKLVAT